MNHKLRRIENPKGDSRYELRIWGLGNKRDVRKRFTSREEANRYVQALYEKHSLEPKTFTGLNSDTSFGDEFDYWLDTKGRTFAPGWRKNIDQYWNDLKSDLAGVKVTDLTKSMLKRLEHKLSETGNSPKTVNEKIGFIVSVLNYSVKMDRITSHKVLNYQKIKVPKKAPQFWNLEEAKDFLSWAKGRYQGTPDHWIYCVYLIALNTGMRAGEIWGLRWGSLMPADGLIHVKEQFDGVKKTFRVTKGKDERYVPLNTNLLHELNQLSGAKPKDGLIFHRHNVPIRQSAFWKRFNRDAKKSSCHKIPFHGLRHSAATLMIASGVDLRTVQEVLGHKNIQTTMRYAHALKERVKNVANTFNLE